MNTLSIDLGINEYQLAPDCVVRFNPTDTAFITKFYNMVERLAEIQEDYDKAIKPLTEPKSVLEEIAKADKAMREVIDSVFDVPICQAIFGDMHVTAKSANGVPVYMELTLALIDQCDIDMTGLAGKGKTYVDKYTKKYMKR